MNPPGLPSVILRFVLLSLIMRAGAAANIVAWYRFDDGTGSVVMDSSGNGNHLSFTGTGAQWNVKPTPPSGGSIHFNGTGSIIAQRTSVDVQPQTINNLRGRTSDKVTICFWANPDTSIQGTALFSAYDATGVAARILQSRLLWTDGRAYFDADNVFGGSYNQLGVPTTSPAGAWTHWALVFDGAAGASAMTIYRNGVLLGSGTAAQGGAIDWAAIDVFQIGTGLNYTAGWAGSLDEFAMWDEALTATQISSVMATGVGQFVSPNISRFIGTPGNIAPGASTVLSWQVENATSLSIDNGVGPVTGPTGSTTVSPASTTTYRLTATNGNGSTITDVVVGVGEPEQPLQITEFLADNQSGLQDEDGDNSDWIEIYNPNPFAISLAGWQLVDSTATWTFPAVQVEGQRYLVVFASNKSRTNPAAPLHTNFALDANGEYLALKKPDGTIVREFAPVFPAQRPDASYGLGAANALVFFLTPTPGAANGPSVLGFVSDTVFNVKRGFFTAPFELSLTSAPAGATIRYTLNGSTPTETNGTVYSAPFTVNTTRTVRARAFLTGYAPTNTDTQTYIFLDDVLNQVYPSAPPPNWPVSGVNGQALRYGFNPTRKAQYSTQQLLDALKQIPSISLVTDQAYLTDPNLGIYVNALNKGDEWERPTSVEYLLPDGSAEFQINAGLRIRGGYSRNDQFPKHAFRLFFRRKYGDAKLKFPLHGTTGTDEFQTLDLRCEQNYSLAREDTTQNTAVREVFCRDLMGALGQPTTRSRYLHLYLNGQYWGLFQTEERPQEDYGASYFGGKADDYDVIQTSNHPNFTYELGAGTVDAWRQLWTLARAHAASPTNANYFRVLGRDANGVRDPALPVYVDLDNLVSYMLLHYYSGDGDAPLSNFLSMNQANNWRGLRNRFTDMGFRFFVHDAEHTLQAPSWVANRANTNAPNGSNRSNFTYSNAEWIHEDLSANPEYRTRFGDLAHRFLFNNGPMTPAAARAIFDARAAQIAQAVIGEYARWGMSSTNHTYAQWQARLDTIRNTFFPTRHTTLLAHLRTRGFYPQLSAPTWSQRGGQVANGSQITLSAGAQTGTIYYTLDGSDPRAIGGGIATGAQTYSAPGITIDAPTSVRTRFGNGAGAWSALDEAYFTTFPPAIVGKLALTKVHYHPSNPSPTEVGAGYSTDSDFEYLELQNISNENIDLSGVQISIGVDFSFANAAIKTLAPGARVVVVSKVAAFTMRYGSGVPIAGEFAGTLANSSDTVRVTDANGALIVELTYGDSVPWPKAADGEGFALVLNDPMQSPVDPLNWRASYALGGKPGAPDVLTMADWRALHFSSADLADAGKEAALWGNAADPDFDGFSNLEEFALGGSPLDGRTHPVMQTTLYTDPTTSQSFLRLSCSVRQGTSGATIAPRASSDLVTWQPGPQQVGLALPQSDGTSIVTWQDTVSTAAAPGGTRFLRVQVDTN